MNVKIFVLFTNILDAGVKEKGSKDKIKGIKKINQLFVL